MQGIDVARATASRPVDEEKVKSIISRTSSFDEVNSVSWQGQSHNTTQAGRPMPTGSADMCILQSVKGWHSKVVKDHLVNWFKKQFQAAETSGGL